MEILGGRDMLPLGLLVSGELAEIVEIRGRGEDQIPQGKKKNADEQVRIEDMGIRVGKDISVLNNTGPGPLLLKVGESRIAMGRGMSMKIWVRRKRP
jgi:ferrous iron transport protein A